MSKILNKGEKYASLNDITDILGIRIISYFEDDVKNISEIIKTEFKVDDKNSEDKIGKLDYNQFGYSFNSGLSDDSNYIFTRIN